jgi:hypothetical protein
VRNGIGCTQQSSTHRQALTATRAHSREDTPGVQLFLSPSRNYPFTIPPEARIMSGKGVAYDDRLRRVRPEDRLCG